MHLLLVELELSLSLLPKLKLNNIQELYEIKLRVGQKIKRLIACCFTMPFYIFCMLLITRRNNEWDATSNWNFNNSGKSYKFGI